jgi:hypothetical protein
MRAQEDDASNTIEFTGGIDIRNNGEAGPNDSAKVW